MQILVLFAYTAVLLTAGTNAASFVNQSQLQYEAVEIDGAEMRTQITGKRLPLPFQCTPHYHSMFAGIPKTSIKIKNQDQSALLQMATLLFLRFLAGSHSTSLTKVES